MSIDDQLNYRDSEAVAAMRRGDRFKITLTEPASDNDPSAERSPAPPSDPNPLKRELAEIAETERLEHQPPRRALTIVVTGSRDWTNHFLLMAVLESYMQPGTQWHVGDARGVDRMTANQIDSRGYWANIWRADWSTGKGAGFARNIEMLETAQPDLVLAFKSAPTSAGTDHTIREARKRGIHVIEIIDHAAPVEPKPGEIPFATDDLREESFPE